VEKDRLEVLLKIGLKDEKSKKILGGWGWRFAAGSLATIARALSGASIILKR
jgi:hypothetical protein